MSKNIGDRIIFGFLQEDFQSETVSNEYEFNSFLYIIMCITDIVNISAMSWIFWGSQSDKKFNYQN